MQYAQVLINTKTHQTDDVFSYKIPAEMLSKIFIGVQVKVPFRNTYKNAIVYKITRNVSSNIKPKLKSIKSVFSEISLLNDFQLKLATKISNYYLQNIGQIAYFMLPKISKRVLSKYKNKIIAQENSNKNFKKYCIYDSYKKRFEHYSKLIKMAFGKNKSAILLVADIKLAKKQISRLKKLFSNTIVFKSNDTKSQKAHKWLRTISSKNPKLIIGTRNTIFNIDQTIGLIIVDEPDNFGFKEEQTIHHNTKIVSILAAKILNCSLVFGDNFYIENTKDFINIKNNITINKSVNKLSILYSTDKNYPLSYSVENIIQNNLNKKRKTLIIASGKEDSAGIICDECKEIFYCPRCEVMLKKHQNYMVCTCCNYQRKIYHICPHCNSTKLVDFGVTSFKIAKYLKNEYNKYSINLITDFKNVYEDTNKFDVLVSTKYMCDYKQLQFDDVMILNWEHIKISQDINLKINLIKFISNACEIAKNKVYINLENEDDFLNNLTHKKILSSIKKIYLEKKKYKYPPYFSIIKIYDKNINKYLLENKFKQLKKTLSNINLNADISDIVQSGKKRDKFYSEIIIKAPRNNIFNIKKELLNNYQRLKLSNFQIDVDPIILL